jgi:GntR family transcriptional regulator
MIDKSSSTPLYSQIQNHIIALIRQGDYPPGAQVPSELELSAQLQVSRMTARKALDGLVAKGVLYRRKGKGTYVAENMINYGLTTMQSFSRVLQSRGYQVSTQMLGIHVIEGTPAILEQLHLPPYSELLVVRRLRLVNDIPAAIHTAYLDNRVYAAITQMNLVTGSLLEAMERVTGAGIAYTIDSVESDLPTPEEAQLLKIEKHRPVLRVDGVSYLEYGEPTRYARAVYRGDMFKLTVRNSTSIAASFNIADINV